MGILAIEYIWAINVATSRANPRTKRTHERENHWTGKKIQKETIGDREKTDGTPAVFPAASAHAPAKTAAGFEIITDHPQ